MASIHEPRPPRARTAGPRAAPNRRGNSGGHTGDPVARSAHPAPSTRRRDLLSNSAAAAYRLGVEYRLIAELKLNDRNPRLHSPKQIRQIARSIKTFGFNVPVLVDREGWVVAGHGRVLACLHLGWTEVPVIRLDHLGPEQARAFMLADNRLAETSCWDERLLAEALRDLDALARRECVGRTYLIRVLRLAHLAPDIVEAILAGREPDGLTANELMKSVQLPLAWDEQRRRLGFR